MKKPQYQYRIPLCTNAKTYESWKAAARMMPAAEKPSYLFCTDCTPEYQSKMIKEGRCENPQVYYMYDVDGMVEGRYPQSRNAVNLAKRSPRYIG